VVIGSVNLDRILKVRGMPAPGETVVGAFQGFTSGGKGANQAAAVAGLGKSSIRPRAVQCGRGVTGQEPGHSG